MTGFVPSVRFDDLRRGRRRAFRLAGFEAVLVADDAGDVPGLLDEVAAASRAGRWAAGYVAYDAAPGFDPALTVPGPGAAAVPAAWFGLYRRRERAPALDRAGDGYRLGHWEPAVDGAAYAAAVARIRDLIAAGDTYQVNYTMQLGAEFTGDPLALYRDLARAQSGGYGAYLDTGRHVVVSASPELFFEWAGDTITSRPMKGTAPRGRWVDEDKEMRAALLTSAKDRAENLMIVDLIRNDLGRVAAFGSVRVDELFAAERFDTVWQLTSTVSAGARPGTSLGDVFAALFPCGSVTGAPKVRTCEIIAALEPQARGVYCGAIGYVAPAGARGPRAAFNVAIRTVHVDRAEGRARYGVGGGVTFDSTPSGEYAEALLKAEVLGRAGQPFELLETMRWDPVDGFYARPLHFARLAESSDYFGFRFDVARVDAALEAAVGGDEALRVRLVLDRQGRCRVETDPAPPAATPVTLAIDTQPTDESSPFLFHKTTRRDVYRAARSRHPFADDVLLVNQAGEVTEATLANVVARLDGRWVTPPIEVGCLPGVRRRALLEAGEITERVLTLADVEAADDLALVSALRGWRPARLVTQPAGSAI